MATVSTQVSNGLAHYPAQGCRLRVAKQGSHRLHDARPATLTQSRGSEAGGGTAGAAAAKHKRRGRCACTYTTRSHARIRSEGTFGTPGCMVPGQQQEAAHGTYSTCQSRDKTLDPAAPTWTQHLVLVTLPVLETDPSPALDSPGKAPQTHHHPQSHVSPTWRQRSGPADATTHGACRRCTITGKPTSSTSRPLLSSNYLANSRAEVTSRSSTAHKPDTARLQTQSCLEAPGGPSMPLPSPLPPSSHTASTAPNSNDTCTSVTKRRGAHSIRAYHAKKAPSGCPTPTAFGV